MSDAVECVVIGGGIIGLAVARALARAGREVLLLEKERWIGQDTSSRNSEVIHAGLYYPQGSLKAKLCVEGRNKLYAYCAERDVPHKRVGKLVVAVNDDEIELLRRVIKHAEAAGVTDLEWLDEQAAKAMEPDLACVGAFHSPSTGIVDTHALMLAYQTDAENAGASVVLRSPVMGGKVTPQGFTLDIGGAEAMTLEAKLVVNCAGLYAPSVARTIAGVPAATIPQDYYCRGVYFTLAGKAPFKRLVYPVPEHAGLGVHLTLDMAGAARFGPDTEWIDGIDYTVDPRRGDKFYAAIRTYWPALPDNALMPGYAGIRPKISGPKEPGADFMIAGPETHGVPGLVNLFGIESPGITSSLALADIVAEKLASA